MLVDPKMEARPFEVMKFRVGVACRVLCLSPLCGLNTHYMRSSRICSGETCPACLAGIPAKYAGYFVVLFNHQRRLIRLTQSVACLGEMNGQWVPGRILEMVKMRERRPLEAVTLGDSKTFDQQSIVSRVELLNVVARLHGLSSLPDGVKYDEALEIVSKNASRTCQLAMDGEFV